jgi:hypothetical protein
VRAHQHSAGAQKSRRGPSDRAIPWRLEHQNPCSGGCPRQPARVPSDRRGGA